MKQVARETRHLLLQLERVALQCKDVVGKHDDLVAAPFVKTDQELAGTELVRIRHVQQLDTRTENQTCRKAKTIQPQKIYSYHYHCYHHCCYQYY